MGLPLDTKIPHVFPITREDCYYLWRSETQINMEYRKQGRWWIMYDDCIDRFDFDNAHAYFDQAADGTVVRVFSGEIFDGMAMEDRLMPREYFGAA